jgi:hypothetical protein
MHFPMLRIDTDQLTGLQQIEQDTYYNVIRASTIRTTSLG